MAEEIIIPEPTEAESGEIKSIAKDTVHRICSGQVLFIIVKIKQLNPIPQCKVKLPPIRSCFLWLWL